MNQAASIRLVAIDLDHTLLTSDWRLAERDRAAIERAAQAGAIIILATGRMPRAVLPYAEQLNGAVKYAISYNGALAIDLRTGSTVQTAAVAPAAIGVVSQLAKQKNYRLAFFCGDEVFSTVENDDGDAVLKHYQRRTSAVIRHRCDPSIVQGRHVHKFLVYDQRLNEGYDPTRESPWERAIHAEITALQLDDLSVQMSRFGCVDCTSSTASKLQALSAILGLHGWTTDNLMAIGDGYNDLEMIRAAKIGVAVRNAVPEVYASACMVVASNDEAGVSEALEKVFGDYQHDPRKSVA